MWRHKTIYLIILAGFSFVASVDAQIGRRDSGLYIRGIVRAEPNFPLENVKVELKRQTGQILDSYFTRSNGQFEFHGLSTSIYVLEINAEGYIPFRQRVEIIGPPGLAGLLIVLRPVSKVRPAGVSAPLSARELAIPEAARAHFRQGEEQLREKRKPKDAVAALKSAVKAHADYYEAHHLLGVAYMELGKLKEAEEALRLSLRTSGDKYGPAFSGLASLLSDQQQFGAAEPLARRAIELEEQTWQGHFELARALTGLGRAQEAEPSASRALELNQDLTRGYLLLAKIHQALQDYPAMLADLDEFLRREPKGPNRDEIRKTRAQLAKALHEAGMDVPPEPPL